MTDGNAPVTHTECRLRHENVDQRFGGLERDLLEVKMDMAEVRKDLGSVKTSLLDIASDSKTFREKSTTFQDQVMANTSLLIKIVGFVLLLVLASGGLDVSAILGGF